MTLESTKSAPKGLMSALAEASEKETLAREIANDGEYEGYPYLVLLHSGLRFRRLARQEPEKLWAAWSQARRHDEILVWADDSATEARQIADIEIDRGDLDGADSGKDADAPSPERAS